MYNCFKQNLYGFTELLKLNDFAGLKAMGYDTTNLEREFNNDMEKARLEMSNIKSQIAKRNSSGSGGNNSGGNNNSNNTVTDKNYSTVFNKAFDYRNNGYSAKDVITYVQNQGLSDESEFQILNSLGLTKYME